MHHHLDPIQQAVFNGQRMGEIYRSENWTAPATVLTDARRFYLSDWQNSMSALTDDQGNLLEVDGDDSWGKRRYAGGGDDTNDAITSQTDMGYNNQYEMTDAQLIDLNARMYDPFLGKMLSVDPAVANLLDPQSWNAYAHARNNPMAFMDPTGKICTGQATQWQSGVCTVDTYNNNRRPQMSWRVIRRTYKPA